MANRISRAVAVAMCMALSLGAAQAAEKISWEKLEKRLDGSKEYRSVSFVTRDGHGHRARSVKVSGSDIFLHGSHNDELLKRADIVRVELRERKRYYRNFVPYFEAPIGLPLLFAALADRPSSLRVKVARIGVEAVLFAIGIVPAAPYLGYGIVNAPLFLTADAIDFLKPSKVFEVIP